MDNCSFATSQKSTWFEETDGDVVVHSVSREIFCLHDGLKSIVCSGRK